MHDTPSPFATTQRLRERAVEAVLAQTGFNHKGLNDALRTQLGSTGSGSGALVIDPLIEGTPGYAQFDETLATMSGGLIRHDVIAALTQGQEGDAYRFPPELLPYRHQVESWNHLTASDPRSVIVTSGTGSGKTECFLVPLLHDLAAEAAHGRLSGVRAIMLYPLNALIASQQERLNRWTAPFGDRIRFGLYNGLTPERLRANDRAAEKTRRPQQALDRDEIRSDPPPILVTNVTMLEYMTIRREDKPLLRNSNGRLRWIIIDEAHSYIGSAAAEIALLLRRVLLAFGVAARDVRFVATSATIGGQGEEARAPLRRFLADLAGVPEDQVHVVQGMRAPVALPPPASTGPLAKTSLGIPALLARDPAVQCLVRAAEMGALSLAEAGRILQPTGLDATTVIEAIADDKAGPALLPMRVHQFMRAIPGLWTCLDPACSGPRPVGWPFGALAFDYADECRHCHGLTFEIEGCRECGEPVIVAFDHGGMLTPVPSPPDVDEFRATSEQEPEETDDAEPREPAPPGDRRLCAVRPLPELRAVGVDPKTGAMFDRIGEGVTLPMTRLDWDGACPHCRAQVKRDGTRPTRPFRYGAPFMIGSAAPVMLDGVPPAEPADGTVPAGGRRLLSFTDSRQGTARFAANIETASERAYVRGFVYHLVQRAPTGDPANTAEAAAIRGQLAIIEPLLAATPVLIDTAALLRSRLANLTGQVSEGMAWNKACAALSHDPIVTEHIAKVWDDRDPRFQSDPAAFARFLILRELARRPRRANALETMGLAQLRFDRIDNQTLAALPDALRRRGRTIEEWRDFLYLLIDMSVRAYFALNVAWDDVRWLLPRGGVRRNIVGPGEERRNKTDAGWPCSRPGSTKSNAVLLLERRLGLDGERAEHRAEINDILTHAWTVLRPLLEGEGSEYALDLGKARIAPVATAWLCPVTRRVIARLAFGATPYGHREDSTLAAIPPLALHFPQLPLTFPRAESDRARIADWLRHDPQIAALRERGVWRDLHDRVAGLTGYIRAEEHSAQQPHERLRDFENEFKRGAINILACSTTMEMGVDIGSVSAVMMTNVPPSIANYRQRVGRAGRRGQAFSSALTFARARPLDRETFREPTAYLRRQLPPPAVKLDAPRIVQRHVNAFLLACWFADASGQMLKANAGPFFGCPDGDVPPPSTVPVVAFGDWLARPSVREALAAPLQALVQGTALQTIVASPVDATIAAMNDAAAQFRCQWDALRAELTDAPFAEARKSVEQQLQRLCRENLLRELSNRAVLPGHGFPTSVIPFLNDSHHAPVRPNTLDQPEASSTRRYGYPSRNADVAIREYAPGAEVVIDGLVWRSAGVTLNWKRPPDRDAANEVQSLKFVWICHACGAADCTRTLIESCPACGLGPIERQRFLEPAGFSVDYFEPPHADTEMAVFIPPEPTKVSVRGVAWQPILDPTIGRSRLSHDGMVFYGASGAAHAGYRLCLVCGRAEEDRGDGTNPLLDHRPLRGSRKTGSLVCDAVGRAFAVTEPIWLGHEILTDVVELQPFSLVDPGGAWALTVALREALARRLGIEPAEMGMAVERRIGERGQSTHSLFLFDRSAGGAGFATRLLDDPFELLQATRDILSCAMLGCVRACAACVLVSDLYDVQDTVDRRPALACLQDILTRMEAPSIPPPRAVWV